MNQKTQKAKIKTKMKIILSEDSKNQKEIVENHSKKLAKLGTELAKNQFSYKVEEKSDEKYWKKRFKEFEDHNEKSLEYYNEIYLMMNQINKEEAELFLLKISKFRQIAIELTNLITKIIENPSIIKSKDTQQSQWSKETKKEIKSKLTVQSDECLRFEKEINTTFREFYDKFIKDILD